MLYGRDLAKAIVVRICMHYAYSFNYEDLFSKDTTVGIKIKISPKFMVTLGIQFGMEKKFGKCLFIPLELMKKHYYHSNGSKLTCENLEFK